MTDPGQPWAAAFCWRVYPYFRLSGLITSPDRMARVETLIRAGLPSTRAVTSWRFGRNVRVVIPVGFRPKPPFWIAWPCQVRFLPNLVFLPVNWHSKGMGYLAG